MGKTFRTVLDVGTMGMGSKVLDTFIGDPMDAQNAAIDANNAAVADARGAVRKGLSDLQSSYLKYGDSLDALDSAQMKAYQDQLLGSLGTGYKKATESIGTQLQGEVQPLVDQYLNEILPTARSAAIDQGAYGGSRDMLTRERLTKDLQDTIAEQAAADIKYQRAQYGALTSADTSNLAALISSLTAKTDLQNQQSDYLYNAALNFANAMSGAGTTQARSTGLDQLMNMLSTGAQVAGTVAKFA